MDETAEIHARLTRIEVGVDAMREILREAIAHGDNTSAQLVALLGARVDGVKADVIATANIDRDNRVALWKLSDEREAISKTIASDLALRVSAMEKFNARLIGFGLGISIATGSVTAAILKAVGT